MLQTDVEITISFVYRLRGKVHGFYFVDRYVQSSGEHFDHAQHTSMSYVLPVLVNTEAMAIWGVLGKFRNSTTEVT